MEQLPTAAAYRRIAQQLEEKAASERLPDIRRDLEAQALHFTLLAEAIEGGQKTSRPSSD